MATSGSNAPIWIQSLVQERNGHGLQFIITKRITKSDLDSQQNRLLIPKAVHVIKLMHSFEESAIDHGGLDIRVFTRNKFRIEQVKLKRWSTDSTVINGIEMKVFRAMSYLKVTDEIEMWAFRDGSDGRFCFAIGKK